MHLQCHAAARNTCRWMLESWLLLPGGQMSTPLVATTLPGTGCQTRLIAQPCSANRNCRPPGVTSPVSLFQWQAEMHNPSAPRAAGGTSTRGQPHARAGWQGSHSNPCLPLLSLPLLGCEASESGRGAALVAPCSRGSSWLLQGASEAGRCGTALPAGSRESASSGSPSRQQLRAE